MVSLYFHYGKGHCMGDNSKLTSYFFAVELELDDVYASDSSGDSFWSKFADGVNALISLGRGDVAGATLSLRFFFRPLIRL